MNEDECEAVLKGGRELVIAVQAEDGRIVPLTQPSDWLWVALISVARQRRLSLKLRKRYQDPRVRENPKVPGAKA